MAKLKANNNRLVIPSLFLANVRVLDNKMYLLRLRMNVYKEMGNCCVLLLTETWLNGNVPDSALQISSMLLHRADRSQLSGKTRGGGLKCRPYYLPRELTAVFIAVVYIPPSAKASEVQGELYENICSLQNNHPDALNVIAGDFNNVNLMDVTPRFYQHVTIATQGNNTLDCV